MEDFQPITRAFLGELSAIKRRQRQPRESYEVAKFIRKEILTAAEQGNKSYTVNFRIVSCAVHLQEPYLAEAGVITSALELLEKWFPDCTFEALHTNNQYFKVSWD